MTPYYQQYEFISPEGVFALVREELSSYFISGAIDDTLFSLWTSKVLKKLTRGALPIRTAFILIDNKKAILPEDFKYIREVWALENMVKKFTDATPTYAAVTAKRIDTPDFKCNPCDTCANREVVQAVYKITSQTLYEFSKTHILRPGKVIDVPGFPCYYKSDASDVYEIEDGYIHTNFESGTLYAVYYAEEYDENNFSLVPDDVYILEAIEYFIRFKLMEMLFNMASDETFNQSYKKKEDAKQEYLEKLVIAQAWMKKETKEKHARSMIKQRHRLNKYKLR